MLHVSFLFPMQNIELYSNQTDRVDDEPTLSKKLQSLLDFH